MDFHLERRDLLSLVEQAIEATRGYGVEANVAIALTTGLAAVEVEVDGDRLVQVLTNLLSNAVKFSPAGGEVEVSMVVDGGVARVSVADRGPGIPDDFRSRIFGRFNQADSSIRRSKGGTGLGLSISKAIVEHFGGRIGFDTVVGEGSTFWFDLPVWRAAPAVPAGARLLLCEDDEDVAAVLAQMLAADGYDVTVAPDAATARRLLGDGGYDALLLDLMLPDEDGLSLLRGLRREPGLAGLPVVVVSARAEAARQTVDGNALGIVDWLSKPIDNERLETTLARALRAPRAPRAGRPRILHVEDDPSVTTIVASMLQDRADVVAAASLAEAEAQLRAADHDLVILDLDLPDGSGFELLSLLGGPGLRRPPVLIFSAADIPPDQAARVAQALTKARVDNQQLLAEILDLLPKAAQAPGSVDP
jgi:DNA-binding response OmpR family regulator/anti-sigma regulatory factor (Ser/Thr protein kinase)